MAFSVLLGLHIAAGAVALVALWIPLATIKGSPIHRRAGRVYAYSMGIGVTLALGLVGYRLLFDRTPERQELAIFLGFVGLLTFANGWFGLRVLRFKNRRAPHDHPLDLGIPALLAVSACALLCWGIYRDAVLPVIFGLLGLRIGIQQVRAWRRQPVLPREWFFQHFTGMIGAGIGTVTAFVVVNADRIGLAQLGLIPWVAPGVLGTIGIVASRRHYRRVFELRGFD